MARQTDIGQAPSLFVTVLRQFTRLVQDEMALARAEVRKNLSRAWAGLALIGIGAILALTALDVLAAALIAWLATNGLSAGTAAVIVGGILLVVAIILAMMGKSRIGADALAPDRTMSSVKADIETMKDTTNA